MAKGYGPVSDKHFQAIGEITVNFAILENWIAFMIWSLIGSDQMLGQIITAEVSFRNRVGLLSSLFRHRVKDTVLVTELEALLNRALQIEEKRNLVVHSVWGSGDSPETITRIKTTAKKAKGLRHQFQKMTVPDLNRIADETSKLTTDLQTFRLKKL